MLRDPIDFLKLNDIKEDDDEWNYILNLLDKYNLRNPNSYDGHKIEAIKDYRLHSNKALKETKDIVEAMMLLYNGWASPTDTFPSETYECYNPYKDLIREAYGFYGIQVDRAVSDLVSTSRLDSVNALFLYNSYLTQVKEIKMADPTPVKNVLKESGIELSTYKFREDLQNQVKENLQTKLNKMKKAELIQMFKIYYRDGFYSSDYDYMAEISRKQLIKLIMQNITY